MIVPLPYTKTFMQIYLQLLYTSLFARRQKKQVKKKQQTHNNNNKKQLLSIVLRTGRQTDKQTNRGERITCIVIALHELSLIA